VGALGGRQSDREHQEERPDELDDELALELWGDVDGRPEDGLV
jgi:hypothetical protein